MIYETIEKLLKAEIDKKKIIECTLLDKNEISG